MPSCDLSHQPVLKWVLAAAVTLNLVALFAPASGGVGLLPGSDKLVHVLLFAAVAWPAVRLGLPWPLVAGVLSVHAVGSEIIQHHLIPGRAGDPADVLADLAGVALGVLTALGWARISRSGGSPSER